jgi:hypothetical protein
VISLCLKNDVNVSPKINKQKTYFLKLTYLSKHMEIDATSITYLSKLVEIDAAVAPGLGGELERDDYCLDVRL